MAAIRTFVYAEDPILVQGVLAHLGACDDIEVVSEFGLPSATVGVIVCGEIDASTLKIIGGIQRDGVPAVLVVARDLDAASLLAAAEAGASGFLRRADASAERLADAVRSVDAGHGCAPPELLGVVLRDFRGGRRDQPQRPASLTDRERAVLRLVAEGLDTAEVASTLHYSERTVKGVLHDLFNRMGVRNRPHAVAFALREGLIQ